MGVPGLYGAFHSLFGDSTMKMPVSKIECDAVFFDMNNILHQSVPPWQEDDQQQEALFFSNFYTNTLRKVSEVLTRIASPLDQCAVYFLVDGCSGLAKAALQKKRRRQYCNFRKNLLPETRMMWKIERVMEKVAQELCIPLCFISPSSVRGENDCKIFAICSEMHGGGRRILIVSRDYDFLFLSLLRIHLFKNVYVYFNYHRVTDVAGGLARALQDGYKVDLRLFVLASFIFGNDFTPKYCTVTRQTLISLLTYIRGLQLQSATGVRLKLTNGTHFWPEYGKSYRVVRSDREKFKSFFDQLLRVVPLRPVKREVNHNQFLWTFKYYLHDQKVNLVSSSCSIYNTKFNRVVLNPLTLHCVMGTVGLCEPPSEETAAEEEEEQQQQEQEEGKLPYYRVT